MIKHEFGSTGVFLPVVGQGTWQLPREKAAIEETIKALRVGIELGMLHIDTAEMYGQAETIIADAIKGLARHDLFLVSKVLPANSTYEGTINACERSLKRLGTDYLDCYLLHWRGGYPLSETMSALEKLVDDGKIRSLGVSNFDVDDLIEAEKSLTKHKIACNQVLYNIYERGIERRLLPYCRKNKIAVVGYTPFGQRKVPAVNRANGAILQEIADKYELSTRQIMLAFLARLDNLFTIPKASQEKHTRENSRAGALKLSDSDIARINAAFPTPNQDTPLAMI